jgi:hypothetical protein
MTATLDDEVADLRRANAELQQRLDERTAERDEALEQQTAAAEVLQVINSSPGDLAPVFDAMLRKAMEVCSAAFGILWTLDGEQLHAVAHRGVPQAYAEFLTTTAHPSISDPLTQRFLAGERFAYLEGVNEYYRAGNRYARAGRSRRRPQPAIRAVAQRRDAARLLYRLLARSARH